jgi:hypothetical protein
MGLHGLLTGLALPFTFFFSRNQGKSLRLRATDQQNSRKNS